MKNPPGSHLLVPSRFFLPYLLFAKDHYSEQQYQRKVVPVIMAMEENRKFIKFGDFYRELETLYENRADG